MEFWPIKQKFPVHAPPYALRGIFFYINQNFASLVFFVQSTKLLFSMNLLKNSCTEVDPEIKRLIDRLDQCFWRQYGEDTLDRIRDDYFADFYDCVLTIEFVSPLSKDCILFQVDCHQPLDEEQIKSFDNGDVLTDQDLPICKSSFFVVNFYSKGNQFEIIKFHDVEDLVIPLWDTLCKLYEIDNSSDDEDDEDEEGEEEDEKPGIVFDGYFISYSAVINRTHDTVFFGARHSIAFINPSGDPSIFFANDNHYNESGDKTSPTVLVLTRTEHEGHIWYYPESEPLVFINADELT